jgi:hypothetical protein
MIGPQVAECAATQTISATAHLLAQQQLARNPRKMANSALWECHGLGRDNKNAVTDYLLARHEVARRHGV